MEGIRFDVDLPAPPDRVWPLLTDRGRLAAWFTETDFVPESGRRFMLWPGPLPGIDGPISAVVLEVAEPRRLVMGWQGPHSQTTMTWTLRPTRAGTQLQVHETGHLGADPTVRERTLRRLFNVDLRSLLRQPVPASAAVLPLPLGSAVPASKPSVASEPSVAPGQRWPGSEAAPMASGVDQGPAELGAAAASGVVGAGGAASLRSGMMFSGALDTPPNLVPPSAPGGDDPTVESRKRRRSVLIGLVALLVLAAVGLWLAWPPTSGSGSRTLPGVGGIGAAPGTSTTGSAPGGGPGSGPGGGNPGTGTGGGAGQPSAGSTSPGSTPGASGQPSAGPGGGSGSGGGGTDPTGPAPQAHLSVAYSVTGTLVYTVSIRSPTTAPRPACGRMWERCSARPTSWLPRGQAR